MYSWAVYYYIVVTCAEKSPTPFAHSHREIAHCHLPFPGNGAKRARGRKPRVSHQCASMVSSSLNAKER